MEKMIPYNKMQKKKQKELASERRGDWGGLTPVTRRPPNPKAYNRKKAGKWRDEWLRGLPFNLSC